MPTPRMAPADPLHGPPASAERAVFVDGVDGVLAAGGLKAAVAAHEGAEGGTVEKHEVDEEPSHVLMVRREFLLVRL